jgi:hypothetical protein
MRGIYTPGSTFVETDASDRLLRYARDFASILPDSIKFDSGLLTIDLFQHIADFQLRSAVFGLDPKKFGESCLKGSESISACSEAAFSMYVCLLGWILVLTMYSVYHPIPGSVPGAVTACASSASYIWFDDVSDFPRPSLLLS